MGMTRGGQTRAGPAPIDAAATSSRVRPMAMNR